MPMLIITFISIILMGIIILLLLRGSNTVKTKSQEVLTGIELIAQCKILYLKFIIDIKNRDFYSLSKFCCQNIIQEIKHIHHGIYIPLHISFTKMTNTINISSTEKIISIDFYCKSIDKFIEDTCEFYVVDNKIWIQRFNKLGGK